MNLLSLMQDVWMTSGLAALWTWAQTWLALDARQLIFVIATPVFVGVTLWEYARIRNDPVLMDAREAVRNFMLGAGYQVTELLFAGIIAFPVYALAYHHRVVTVELSWATGLLLFVLVDFTFYWFHRASHRVRWLWCTHVTHHSSERMNFSTAMRQNATNIFNGGWLFYVPLAFIGFNPVWIGICFALSLVYQFFIHTTLVTKLHPAIEFVMNTPNHHRVHHASNEGYIDTNYAGVFIVWDRLFGTFAEEQAGKPVRYGITRPVHSDSLWVMWTHEYVDLFRDMARPGTLTARLKHLWMPPEWERRAEATGENSAA